MFSHLRIAVAVSSLFVLASAASAQKIKVADATLIRLATTQEMSSATSKVDDPVPFEVTEDVKQGDAVLITRGTTAMGHVVEAEPRKRMGRSGKLNFSIDFVKAPDGNNIRLRAVSARKGEDKTGTVIVGSVIVSPLFLIMRGKDVTIPKGTMINAYVDGDREFNAGSAASTEPQAAKPGLVSVSVSSSPRDADITVDGKFVGTTPSSLRLAAGEHTIVIEKKDHKAWQRTMSLTGGDVNLNATLEK